MVLGSVAGDRARRKNYIYGAAKAGLHAYLEGLWARMRPAGVSVTIVKPGFVDTSMTWGQPRMFHLARLEDLARACLQGAEQGRAEIYYPGLWRPIMAVIKRLPRRFLAKLGI